jgi:hypothetical protein
VDLYPRIPTLFLAKAPNNTPLSDYGSADICFQVPNGNFQLWLAMLHELIASATDFPLCAKLFQLLQQILLNAKADVKQVKIFNVVESLFTEMVLPVWTFQSTCLSQTGPQYVLHHWTQWPARSHPHHTKLYVSTTCEQASGRIQRTI